MRTFEELHLAAMQLRTHLLTEGKEPTDTVFTVTHHERCVLLDQPMPSVTVDHAQQRFCGFRLHVI